FYAGVAVDSRFQQRCYPWVCCTDCVVIRQITVAADVARNDCSTMVVTHPAQRQVALVVRQRTYQVAVTCGASCIKYTCLQQTQLQTRNVLQQVLTHMGVVDTGTEAAPVVFPGIRSLEVHTVSRNRTGVNGSQHGGCQCTCAYTKGTYHAINTVGSRVNYAVQTGAWSHVAVTGHTTHG